MFDISVLNTGNYASIRLMEMDPQKNNGGSGEPLCEENGCLWNVDHIECVKEQKVTALMIRVYGS